MASLMFSYSCGCFSFQLSEHHTTKGISSWYLIKSSVIRSSLKIQLVFDQIVGNPIFTENLSSVEIAVVIDFFAMIREINQNAVRMAYHLDDLMDYFIVIASGIGIFCNTLTALCIQIGSRFSWGYWFFAKKCCPARWNIRKLREPRSLYFSSLKAVISSPS